MLTDAPQTVTLQRVVFFNAAIVRVAIERLLAAGASFCHEPLRGERWEITIEAAKLPAIQDLIKSTRDPLEIHYYCTCCKEEWRDLFDGGTAGENHFARCLCSCGIPTWEDRLTQAQYQQAMVAYATGQAVLRLG